MPRHMESYLQAMKATDIRLARTSMISSFGRCSKDVATVDLPGCWG